MDPPTLDEGDSTAPASSVFFDSAPTGGRASRFRQLFAQDPPAQPASLDARPSVDRTTSNPVFDTAPKSSATAEDREGFQRIMAMLGGGGPQKSSVPVLPYLSNSNTSSWKNRLQHNPKLNPQFQMDRLKVNLEASSFNDYFGKDKEVDQFLLHS